MGRKKEEKKEVLKEQRCGIVFQSFSQRALLLLVPRTLSSEASTILLPAPCAPFRLVLLPLHSVQQIYLFLFLGGLMATAWPLLLLSLLVLNSHQRHSLASSPDPCVFFLFPFHCCSIQDRRCGCAARADGARGWPECDHHNDPEHHLDGWR